MRHKYITGVGSRQAPKQILLAMAQLAGRLVQSGWTVRTGTADGADAAFIMGAEACPDRLRVYGPSDATPTALQIARKYHPAWDRCSDYAKRLHARNVLQVLGDDLKTPSKLLVCWTLDGCKRHGTRTIKTGGTGTAISIASENGVPVYNLKNTKDMAAVQKWLANNKTK